MANDLRAVKSKAKLALEGEQGNQIGKIQNINANHFVSSLLVSWREFVERMQKEKNWIRLQNEKWHIQIFGLIIFVFWGPK